MSIEQKLEELREQWKREPENRSKIEMRVKILKIGQLYPLFAKTEDPFISNVKKALY